MQNARLMCLQIFGRRGTFGAEDAAVRAYQYAIRNGADVINNS
jgi:hypothetical protein